MLGYPGLAVVRELGSDDATWPLCLLVGFSHLPFAIWFSLLLVGLFISGWSLLFLWVCKPMPSLLGDQLSPGGTCEQRALEQPLE